MASILAPTAFTFAADLLATREGAERGVTWDTMYDDPFSLGELMGLLLVDACVYTVAAWYLSRVLPTAHGTPLPWWFIFSLKFWRGPGRDADAEAYKAAGAGAGARGGGRRRMGWGRAILDVEEGDIGDGTSADGTSEGDDDGDGRNSLAAAAAAAEDAASAGGATIEPVAITTATTTAAAANNRITPAVVIQGLSKTYNPKGSCAAFLSGGGHPVHAVKPLHLALYEGQVTGLLGPNGAGKSTTIAMLTGLTPPSSGDARVSGHSLRHSLAGLSSRPLTPLTPHTPQS